LPPLLDYNSLYRLPFSKNDNFNGWIEITTECNMRCPGCYRGCDLETHQGAHKSLDAILDELSQLERLRNPSMISISGGEALLHPDLDAVVRTIRARRMHPVLFTNGLLLTTARLRELKAAGLTGVVVRIDTLQAEHARQSEAELNAVRARVARLAEEADLFLTLTACLDASNLGQIGAIAEWAQANSQSVGQCLWILRRTLVLDPADPPSEAGLASLDDLLAAIRTQLPDLRFAAYLGSEAEAQQARWLQAMRLVLRGNTLGWVDARFIELLQSLSHLFTGRYLGIREKRHQQMGLLAVAATACVNRSFRALLRHWLGLLPRSPLALFRRAQVQAFTVVVPPHFVGGRRDLCDGCPDEILHEGNLVPSCCLEEILRYGRPFERD
jgi:hypothetical protein